MVNLLTVGISFFIGFFTIRQFRIAKVLSLPLCLTLSIGLGLSISSLLFFFSLYVFGQFHQIIVISLNLGVLCLFITLNIFFPPTQIEPCAPEENSGLKSYRFYILAAILWIGLIITIAILARQYPYGGWDAWGLYNMKSKFLLFAKDHWQNVATTLHWHTQPSYPLLLPLINSWLFSIFQTNLIEVASLTSVIFCVSTGLLMYAGLARFIKKELALLGCVLLMSNPWWIFWSTVQYADILLGYFLLANFILIALLLREKNNNLAILTGVFLGLMTFAKNEGLAILAILVFLTGLYLYFNNRSHRPLVFNLVGRLLSGALAGSCGTILFRLTIAPATREVQFNPLTQELKYFNIHGFLLTTRFFLAQSLSHEWNFIWIALAVVGILQLPKFFKKECKVFTLFFALYAMVLLYVYLSTAHFDLAWRLTSTASRILGNLLPSFIFFVFYTIWRKEEI